MSESFSLALVGRLKHGALVQAMADRGWSQADLAKALNTTPSDIARIVNLRQVPSKRWMTSKRERVLLDITGKLPEDLWPEWMDRDWLEKDKRIGVIRDVPVQRLLDGHTHGLLAQPDSPDRAVDQGDLRRALSGLMHTLTPREEKVVTLLFGLDGQGERTLDEVGDLLGGKSKERVRQIKEKAVRKLRHRSRSKKIVHFAIRTHSDDVKSRDWGLASWRAWLDKWESEAPLEQSDVEARTEAEVR